MLLNPRAAPPRSSFSTCGNPVPFLPGQAHRELTHAFSSAEAEREGGLKLK